MRAMAASLALLSACFSPELGPTPFTCKSSSRCPDGYRCVDGLCRRDQAPADSRSNPDLIFHELALTDGTPGDRPAYDAGARDQLRLDLPKPDSASPPTPGFVVIKPGTFVMGSPAGEPCRDSTDETQHQVTLTHAFEIMIWEVNLTRYNAVMGGSHQNANKSCPKAGECPVEYVTWHDAVAFANAFSQSMGKPSCYSCSSGLCTEVPSYAGSAIYDCPGYRLPTEAEWEYAYRAGTTSALYNGAITASDCWAVDPKVAAIAWYFGSTPGGTSTQPVGKLAANAWLLFDLAGNVWEWVNDWYGGDLGSTAATNPVGVNQSQARIDPAHTEYGPQRVGRGGAFFSGIGDVRAASRKGFGAKIALFTEVGFRLARTR